MQRLYHLVANKNYIGPYAILRKPESGLQYPRDCGDLDLPLNDDCIKIVEVCVWGVKWLWIGTLGSLHPGFESPTLSRFFTTTQ